MSIGRRLGLCMIPVVCIGIAQAQAETIQVVIDKLVFSPTVIAAKIGDTIEWINKDPLAHTATVKDGWEVMIPPKKTVTQRLDKEETVGFFCRFHPNMKGSLTVKAE